MVSVGFGFWLFLVKQIARPDMMLKSPKRFLRGIVAAAGDAVLVSSNSSNVSLNPSGVLQRTAQGQR